LRIDVKIDSIFISFLMKSKMNSTIGIYGPQYSGKSSLIERLTERGVKGLEEFPAETFPQPGHSLVIVMCTRNPSTWDKYMEKAVEVYPVEQVVPVVACADKKETLDKRLRNAPVGSWAVDLRPKQSSKQLQKLSGLLQNAKSMTDYINEAYKECEESEIRKLKAEKAKVRRKEKRMRQKTADDDGWIQV
jgi:hypothetical protein